MMCYRSKLRFCATNMAPSEAEHITPASRTGPAAVVPSLKEEALSNLGQQPEISEVVHEDEEGWVSDQSLPEDTQTKVQVHAEKRACAGRGSRKRRVDIHRPSIHSHHHPRVPLPAQIDTTAPTGSSTATATAPSAPCAIDVRVRCT
jgi:hypothetical protein